MDLLREICHYFPFSDADTTSSIHRQTTCKALYIEGYAWYTPFAHALRNSRRKQTVTRSFGHARNNNYTRVHVRVQLL